MRITPKTAPVGARLLVKRRGSSFDEPFEVVIVEWAPSGSAVKWRHERGGETWTEDAVKYGVLVETLPPKNEGLAQEGCDAEMGRNQAETGQGSILGR